jgi:hypothetical protein
MWGTAFFTRYYLVCGVGAALTDHPVLDSCLATSGRASTTR